MQPALLEVRVNDQPAGEPVLLLKASDGALYASAQTLEAWRLTPGDTPSHTQDGTIYYRLDRLPGLKLELLEASQSLNLTAPPEGFKPTTLGYAQPDMGPMTRTSTGGFLNYELLAQFADGRKSLGGTVEMGAFTSFGTGISTFLGHWDDADSRLTRLETNWTFDDPARAHSLRLGDSITRGGLGTAPMRFGGIQFARNFAVQPGFVTLPMPSVRGSAALPSVVDVYVNQTLAEKRNVPPGPFEITGIPVVSGGGDVQLVVRDLLGREAIVRQSYYTAPQLLRRGLDDFSYELGFLRRNFGRASGDYGSAFVSATHRYGVSDGFTAEAHVEATAGVQEAGLGASVLVPDLGLLNVAVAASSSDRGEGALLNVGFERRTPYLSYGVLAEFTTEGFVSVGSRRAAKAAATTVHAFAGIPLGWGSLGLSYLRRNSRGEPEVDLASANLSMHVGRFGTLQFALRQSLIGERDTAAELRLVVPLGRRSSVSGGAELRGGEATLLALLQMNLPAGEGIGYRLGGSIGGINRFDGNLSAQTDFGTYGADVTWIDGKTGLRVTAAGGFGAVGGRIFASRTLSQSFASVQVGHYAGVRVYADNQLVGRTDSAGRAIVPRLRPFDRNAIRIELADLPMDALVSGGERIVRPYNRSGVAVDFQVTTARAAMVRVVREDGAALPGGFTVHIDGRDEEFVSAPGGEVYFAGLAPQNSGVATWTGGSCAFSFAYVEGKDAQPHLGDVPCRAVQ